MASKTLSALVKHNLSDGRVFTKQSTAIVVDIPPLVVVRVLATDVFANYSIRNSSGGAVDGTVERIDNIGAGDKLYVSMLAKDLLPGDILRWEAMQGNLNNEGNVDRAAVQILPANATDLGSRSVRFNAATNSAVVEWWLYSYYYGADFGTYSETINFYINDTLVYSKAITLTRG